MNLKPVVLCSVFRCEKVEKEKQCCAYCEFKKLCKEYCLNDPEKCNMVIKDPQGSRNEITQPVNRQRESRKIVFW